MTRHSLLRLAICNVLFIGIIVAIYAGNNLNIQRSYAVSQDFPSQYFAPNVDATLGGNPFPSVISQVSKAAGTRYYELGYISTKRGQCQAGWGGMNSLTYMQGDIDNLRANGGDIILNFGGYAASNPDDSSVNPQQQEELALSCPTLASLRAQYQQAITAYKATRVAFAIEGDALSSPKYAASVIMRDLAIAGLKSGVPGTKLCVEFTLTGTTTGLTDKGEVLLKDAIDKGINICLVNILAMNYGSSAPVNQPGIMGQYAVDAAKESFVQLKYLFSKKTDSQVWSMMGVTIMNGVNNASGEGGREIFSLSDASTLLQFASKNKIRELSMRELHRDQPPSGNVIAPTDTVTATPTTNSGIQQKPYDFSKALNGFTPVMCPPGTLPSNVDVPPPANPPAVSTPSSGGGDAPNPTQSTGPLAGVTPIVIPTPSSGGSNGSRITPKNGSRNGRVDNPNCITPPNTGGPIPGIPTNSNCSTTTSKNQNIQSLEESSNKTPRTQTSNAVSAKQNSTIPIGSNATGSRLGLAIGKSGNQLQVGQVVTYQLMPCNIPAAGAQMIVISDTISGGLTGLKTLSRNWQIISNPTLTNGSIEIIAIYTGSRTLAPGGILPPFIFSGRLTAAASPVVTSFGLVALVEGTSGALGPSGLSGASGPIGVSLNANITNWAGAVDTLSVLSPKTQ
ncbi:MAG TPA: hypothetical protein VHV10_04035 [Ktedonobacteraceae bacterium]|nr:hypothetical protein [Ktedonobacteraceae bacterium]